MCQTSSNKSLAYRHATNTGHNVGFSSVAAGNMSMTVLQQDQTTEDTAINRRNLEELLGITPGTTRFVSQTHSARVVTSGPRGWATLATQGEADAIVSPDGNDPIAILVADCLPVTFTTDYGPTAVAHAGRVGLLDGVLENTVAELRALDAHDDGEIYATIGPSICGRCYEVPESMRDEVSVQHPALYSETSWGTPALDLPAAAEAILRHAGVVVQRVDECTRENHQLYSHRRQPGAGRLTGIVWKPAISTNAVRHTT